MLTNLPLRKQHNVLEYTYRDILKGKFKRAIQLVLRTIKSFFCNPSLDVLLVLVNYANTTVKERCLRQVMEYVSWVYTCFNSPKLLARGSIRAEWYWQFVQSSVGDRGHRRVSGSPLQGDEFCVLASEFVRSSHPLHSFERQRHNLPPIWKKSSCTLVHAHIQYI